MTTEPLTVARVHKGETVLMGMCQGKTQYFLVTEVEGTLLTLKRLDVFIKFDSVHVKPNGEAKVSSSTDMHLSEDEPLKIDVSVFTLNDVYSK